MRNAPWNWNSSESRSAIHGCQSGYLIHMTEPTMPPSPEFPNPPQPDQHPPTPETNPPQPNEQGEVNQVREVDQILEDEESIASDDEDAKPTNSQP